MELYGDRDIFLKHIVLNVFSARHNGGTTIPADRVNASVHEKVQHFEANPPRDELNQPGIDQPNQ